MPFDAVLLLTLASFGQPTESAIPLEAFLVPLVFIVSGVLLAAGRP